MRLNFDTRARAILRRLPVVNVYSTLELLLLAGLAIQIARLVWAVVTPVSPLGDWRPTPPAIPASPGDVLRGFDPFYRISGAQAGPAVVTSLQLKLFGTRIDEAMGRGSAIIAGPDGVQKSIAVGEEIAPGVILRAVAFDHVSIERGGAREDLFLDQSGGGAPAAPVPGGAPAGGGGGAARGAPTFAALQDGIGFVPRIEGGRVSGLVLRPEGDGGAFRAAGFREGDLLKTINGRPVQGPADVDRLSEQLDEGGTLAAVVERDGQQVPVSVTVAPR